MNTNLESERIRRSPPQADVVPDALGLERLLSVAELSEYLDVSVATIYDWRVDGKGPRALRVGRHLRFAIGDVQAWLATLREAEPGKSNATGW